MLHTNTQRADKYKSDGVPNAYKKKIIHKAFGVHNHIYSVLFSLCIFTLNNWTLIHCINAWFSRIADISTCFLVHRHFKKKKKKKESYVSRHLPGEA